MARNSNRGSTTATLMTGCALAALLTAVPRTAAAQSFNGSPNVVAGDALVTTGPGTTDVQVFLPETVINWSSTVGADPKAIDFQPAGTTATFTAGPNTGDYTVLNRILPVDSGGAPANATVAFNGTVNSTLFGGGAGGNIWFYSPTGIIAGPTATFNVGSLILTTDDIQFVPGVPGVSNGSIYGPGGLVQFRGGAGSTGFVDIQPGAKITANGASSYVALVAPRVQQGGTVSANGPIGYIGAEQVDMTINAGLFDISILAGTTDANGVVHTGTTTGSASTGFFDRKQITMVAVPKSTALTMLLSGSIGYTPAVNAYDDGSSVVLSAGDLGSPDGNIAIGDTAFGNRLDATATGSITVAPTPGDSGTGAVGGTASFANFTSLSGVRSVTLTADHGSLISTALGINLSSTDPATGGNVTIEALGASGLSPAGQMKFVNGLYATAGSTDFGTGDATVGNDGLGGAVTLRANGGDIAADYISLDGHGEGAQGTQRGGDGHAGSVTVSAGYGGSITTGSTSLYATGRGGGAYDPEGSIGYGGAGYGGSITLHDFGTELGTDNLGGTLALGAVYLNASADGGYTFNAGTGHGGNAFGGTIDIALNRRNQIFSSFYANADAHDGDTSIDPMGGTVNLRVGGGITVNVASDMYLTANAVAGVNGGPGAIGQGGTVNLTVNGGASLYGVGSFYGQARADVAVPFGGLPIDSSPDLIGGTVNVLADGGTFHARDFYIDVGASNIGAGTLAGSATGGTVSLGADNGGSLYTASIGGVGGFFNVLANGEGSSGASANVATGGTVNLFANNGGTVTAFGSTISVGAAAGDDSFAPDTSGVGVNAFGGTINIDALGGTIQSGIGANVTAAGGSADGDAGDGAAGEVHVRSLGGRLTSLLNVSAEGYGGQSLVSGNGGDGRGGSLTLLSDAAATYAGFELSFLSESAGGSAAAGAGGDGYGGHANVDVLGGKHTWTSVFMRGDSYGAASLGSGSLGGSAFGDPAGLNFHVGGGELTISNGMTLNASAFAGDYGGPLAKAMGGSVALTVDGGGSLTTPSIYAYAAGHGNFGDVLGGKGTGGTISFVASNGGTISTPVLGAYADAQGGGSDATGGDAVGGSITLQSTKGLLDLDSVDFVATASAGYGDNAGAATGGKASIVLDGGLYDWSNVSANVGAFAGVGGAQGNVASGLADAIDLSLLNGAALTVAGGLDLNADAYGTFNPGAGSAVRAGGISLSIAGDSSLAFGFLDASAQAGLIAPLNSEAPSTTPDTFGGTITLTADGSALSGQSVGLFADAFQLGALNNAGAAQGGTVAVNLLNASSLTLTSGEGSSDLNLSANGYGAVGDSAADAYGGSATLTISNSAVSVATAIDVAALGAANDEAAFMPAGPNITGFNATGGAATVNLVSSGTGSASLTAGNLTVEARGDASTPQFFSIGIDSFPSGFYGGPFAGNGGTGTGGTATLSLGGGVVTLPEATVTADGSGGISAANGTVTPFQSGDGRGGFAAVMVSGGANTIDSLTVSAKGYGRDGTSAGGSGSPALAGDGFGGDASLTSSGGTFQSDTLTIDATGLGGRGGDGPDDSSLTPGGDGGNGTGGTARLVSTAGGTGALTLPAFNLAATGVGGTGGDAALGADGNGGNGIGGTAAAQLADGAFSLGPVILDADGTGGNGATGGEGRGGAAQFALIDSAGPSGARAMGSLSLHASGVGGTGTTGTVAASDAGATALSVAVGGSIAALVVTGDFEAIARGSRAAAGSGFTATNSGALFRVNGNANIDTARDVTIAASSPIFVTGGFTSLSRSFTETGLLSAAGFIAITAPQGISADQLRTDNGTTSLLATNGPINVANLTSFGDVTALGRSIHIANGGRLNVASAQATAGDLFIHAAGNLTLQSASATGAMDFAGNAVTANSALAPGGAFSASGTNGVSLVSLVSGGPASLTSSNGGVSASGDVTSTGAFAASGRTGVSFGNLVSGGTTALNSSNGNILIGDLDSSDGVSATGLKVDISSTGNLTFDQARATSDNLTIRTGGDLAAATLSANQDMALTAGGIFRLTGEARAANIAVTSGDIEIGGTAALGVRGTTREIDLSNGDPSQEAFIGGAHQTGAYSLDSDEITRLFADNGITLGVTGIGLAPDQGHVTVGDLALSFGGAPANIGSGGYLEISTPTKLSIVGNVALTTVSANDRFIIDPARVELNTDTGSIAMLDAAGNPLGQLNVTGDTVAVGTAATLNQLGILTDFSAINALLDMPGGKADPLRAGTMTFNIVDGLFIQNTGASTAAADRRGFAANGLDITTESASTRISINGLILQGGTPVTGLATAPLVRINGLAPAVGGQFDPKSTINGCALGFDCSPPPPPDTRPDYFPPPNDELEPPVTPGNPGEGTLSSTLIQLQDNEPLISPPLVDEPITGVGNDDLWVPECTDPKQEGCPQQNEAK